MADGRDFDVVIVGAGPAGIAACRHLAAAKLRVIALEARDRLGGRAWTVPTALGKPVDLGCEWLHSAEINPWSDIAVELGFTLDKTLPDWTSRIAIHHGEAAHEDCQRARDEFEEAYERAAKLPYDQPASALLRPGGRWNQLFDAISTWANGAELNHVSVKDRQNYDNTALNWRCYDGYGALMNAYAAGLPIERETVVRQIDHGGRRIRIGTNRGELTAAAAIVTVSTTLLAEEAIRFTPALPQIVAAAHGLPCGVANKCFLALDGTDPTESYRHLIGRTDRTETGNYQLRPHGWPMISCYFGGGSPCSLSKPARTRWPPSPSMSSPPSSATISGRDCGCLRARPGASTPSPAAPIPAPFRAMPMIARSWRGRSTSGCSLPAKPARPISSARRTRPSRLPSPPPTVSSKR